MVDSNVESSAKRIVRKLETATNVEAETGISMPIHTGVPAIVLEPGGINEDVLFQCRVYAGNYNTFRKAV